MYRLVHAFHYDKASAKKILTTVKKKWESAELEEDISGCAIVLYKSDNYQSVENMLHKAYKAGVWCGIQEV